MSISAILFLVIFAVGVYLTFKHPFYGIALYIFEWHNHPPYMWWGDPLPDLRWSLLVALLTLASMIINFKKLKPLKGASYALIWWLVAFTVWMYVVSMFFAIDPYHSFRRAENFLKLTIQIMLMSYLVREKEHIRFVFWTMILSVANFGRVAFERGSNRYLGVIAPNATEENAISAHVAAVLPWFGLYFMNGKRWEKIVTFLSIPFLVNLIILANSRASFMAVVSTALLMLIWVKGRLRLQVLAGIVGGIILVFALANEQFWERQQTIREYEDEGSAMSRFYLWSGAYEMWKDNPFGLGGEGFEALVIEYVPELAPQMREEGAKTVHSTFFLVLVEWGAPGVIIFIGFTIHMIMMLGTVKRRSRMTTSYRYYVDAIAIQMGIVALIVAGLTHNRLYAEVYYWFGAFAVILKNIQHDEIITEFEKQPVQESTLS